MSVKKYFQHLLRLSPLRKMRLYHLARFYSKQGRMRRIVKAHGGDIKGLKPLIKKAIVDYHWDFKEFFMYNFQSLSPKERRMFVPEYDKNVFCDKVNDFKDAQIFDSKWETYRHFSDFFKRDCVLVPATLDGSRDSEFTSFLAKHRSFILKPDSAASGRGIAIIHSDGNEDAVRQIANHIKNKNERYILEELISQNIGMSKFHPSSVNSLRIRTFRFDDRVEILPSNMRIGCGDSVVDNTGKGGISVALDSEGKAISACNEAGVYYETHPDTGEQIIGEKVPGWEDALELARQLALVVPSVRYVGWDLALTDSGWVMIEGNDKGMFVGIQKPTQKGFRPRLDKILAEMNIKL